MAYCHTAPGHLQDEQVGLRQGFFETSRSGLHEATQAAGCFERCVSLGPLPPPADVPSSAKAVPPASAKLLAEQQFRNFKISLLFVSGIFCIKCVQS